MQQNDNNNANNPIGIFDSGMGGLTVLRELVELLPGENYIYLGDTARLPYGTKSQQTVVHYATQLASSLVTQKIKLLVVACNTAATSALVHLRHLFPELPIIGVVEPGAREAINTTQTRCIGLLATETTINSQIYPQFIHALDSTAQIKAQSCGLFVALAEEGCVDNEIARLVCAHYLAPLIEQQPQMDTLILGCTHFPVLQASIAAYVGDKVTIINSAKAVAKVVKQALQSDALLNIQCQGQRQFWVTDSPERFIRIGKLFLKSDIDERLVSLINTSQTL